MLRKVPDAALVLQPLLPHGHGAAADNEPDVPEREDCPARAVRAVQQARRAPSHVRAAVPDVDQAVQEPDVRLLRLLQLEAV